MAQSITRPLARAVIATLALAALMAQLSAIPARAAVSVSSQCAGEVVASTDTTAPTTPTSFRLVSRTKSGSVTLGWVASYDLVGVAGYCMYRNGSWSGTLYQAGVDLIGTVWYDKLGGRTKTTVTYQLYAFDAAGNVSVPATLMVSP